MRGQMLWFNEAEDRGFIRTDEGERLSVLGPAFAEGKRPEGRCAGSIVEFGIAVSGNERQAQQVTVVEEVAPRRARRHSQTMRSR